LEKEPSRPVVTGATSAKYYIEVYEPGSAADAVLLMESSAPFLAIRPGDLVNPRAFDSRRWPACLDLVGKLLVVVRVEHAIWEVGDMMSHKLMLYTEAVADDREARLANSSHRPRGRPRCASEPDCRSCR
jgi:hypothetical protein